MTMNQVVVHFLDGHVAKGITNDFVATKDRLHLAPSGAAPGSKPMEILFSEAKAIFFVKSLQGQPAHHKSNAFDPSKSALGRKLSVTFKDGETMVGTTQGYQPGRPGFFIIPADSSSNNERCFIVSAATKEIRML
jgi:hypothetical protein